LEGDFFVHPKVQSDATREKGKAMMIAKQVLGWGAIPQ